MHACGHDGHTTVALGVAKIMSQLRPQLAGRIKFVFQPAEEIVGGAKAMVEDGVLENPRPDVTLGLHLWNTKPLGFLGVADGPVLAGSGTFNIVVRGKGAHAASPHLGADPVACAAQLVTALQTIVSRNVNPLEQAVVSVTYVRAGTATNIIPEDAELKGTFRTFKDNVRDLVMQRIREISEAVSQAMGCTARVEVTVHTEPVANHPEVAKRVRATFERMGMADQFSLNERTMGAEDVGFMMQDIPGMYFFVGSANSERGLDFGHHHPRFDFDEDVLPLCVALMSAAVADYLLPG
jgi:amidohydrolase